VFLPWANIIETAKAPASPPPCFTAVEVARLNRCPRESWTVHTVFFAPVDEPPFAALPPGTVPDPGAEPTPLLASLKFHVISGAYSRSDLVDQPSLGRAWRGP